MSGGKGPAPLPRVNSLQAMSNYEYCPSTYNDLHANQRSMLTPGEIFVKSRHYAEEKIKMKWYKILILSMLGGMFISFSAATTMLVAGTMKEASWNPNSDERNHGVYKLVFGAFGYPLGLSAIVIMGADLFTSHCVYTTIGFLEGKLSVMQVLYLLSTVWLGNFIGSVATAFLFEASDAFDHGKDKEVIYTTEAKLNLSWSVIIVKGILANIFVGMATVMQMAALDVTGKVIAIFLPIFTFAAIGFEHSIANMFILSMGCLRGAEYTLQKFLVKNILGSTIGNWIGAVFFISVPFAMVFGDPIKAVAAKSKAPHSTEQGRGQYDVSYGSPVGLVSVSQVTSDQLSGISELEMTHQPYPSYT